MGGFGEASHADPQWPSLEIRNAAIVVQHARPIIGKQVELTVLAFCQPARASPWGRCGSSRLASSLGPQLQPWLREVSSTPVGKPRSAGQTAGSLTIALGWSAAGAAARELPSRMGRSARSHRKGFDRCCPTSQHRPGGQGEPCLPSAAELSEHPKTCAIDKPNEGLYSNDSSIDRCRAGQCWF